MDIFFSATFILGPPLCACDTAAPVHAQVAVKTESRNHRTPHPPYDGSIPTLPRCRRPR